MSWCYENPPNHGASNLRFIKITICQNIFYLTSTIWQFIEWLFYTIYESLFVKYVLTYNLAIWLENLEHMVKLDLDG